MKRSFKEERFKVILDAITADDGSRIDVEKVGNLTAEEKDVMVLHLAAAGVPILVDLTDELGEARKEWLASMGYLYTTVGREYTFLHKSHHKIR